MVAQSPTASGDLDLIPEDYRALSDSSPVYLRLCPLYFCTFVVVADITLPAPLDIVRHYLS